MIPNNRSKGFHYAAISTCLFDKSVYDVYCIVPAFIIITILAFLNKRVRIKPKSCDGRPGLVLPCCFVRDSNSNRLAFAVAFGAIEVSCYKLFTEITGYSFLSLSSDPVIKLGRGPWGKELTLVVWVLLYGWINFPIFACLMTDHLLVGALFGFLYTLMKFTVALVLIFSCPNAFARLITKTGEGRAYEQSVLYTRLPDLLCHLFLLIHFWLVLTKVLRRKVRGAPAEDSTATVAKRHDYIHVDLLLGDKLNDSSNIPHNWYIRLKDKIYKPRPGMELFLLKTKIHELVCLKICTVVGCFLMTVSWTILMSIISKIIVQFRRRLAHTGVRSTNDYVFSIFLLVYEVVEESLYLAVFFTCALSVLLMLHFMKCHREDILMSYKVKRDLGNSPSRLVIRSISYPGYQIAYIGWGYNLVLVNLIFVIFFIGFCVKFLNWAYFWDLMQHILPLVVLSMCVWFFQYLMGRLVFRDRRFPDKTININNHRLYCIMSYFFFFFNIWVGYISSTLRMVGSTFLESVFFARIDRTPLMLGYHNWDQGKIIYGQ
ncbi:stimulated by retinoic acid gene 6 protein-like [Actinia tenebrosa]|uniref:Stimulated by retinoic acid gene 6 protein-like n=1 Tax=Actinia tenebrosa TaxID=6105 RepID=A0A6P8H974_ACTTE|nr:stimulated by retinoic acid gene 6 protein-like [Actinia tenebrosa]